MSTPQAVDIAQVRRQLGIEAEQYAADIESIADAVNALIAGWVPNDQWDTASTKLGANMLTARLWRRRTSPSGVEALGELGSVYVARHDPDIAQMLGLAQFRRLQVG